MGKALFVFAMLLVSGVNTYAQSYKMHSVFIYSFTRYFQWPEEYNKGNFEIVVLGDTPLLDELKTMSETKKVMGGRTIVVTRIMDLADLKKCHMLILPGGRSALLKDALDKTLGMSALIITEEPGLGLKGSMVNFITKEGKLAFELNQGAVNKKGLKVSNELIRLAILI